MAWLSGWAKRIEVTSDHTKVDADVSDFPARLKISTASGISAADVSAIFDELGSYANRKKIAVTTSDGTTQCYVEIDEWDHAGEIADLWVKFPALSSSADNIFYFYYDSTQSENTSYVGDTGDVPAQNVWDANFVMVQHMKDATTSTIIDSTSNANDGAKVAANEPIEVAGKIGKGQDFDGVDDNISVPNSSSLSVTTKASFLCWVYCDVFDGHRSIYEKNECYMLYSSTGSEIANQKGFRPHIYSNTWKYGQIDYAAIESTWYRVAYTYDSVTGEMLGYINGVNYPITWSAQPAAGETINTNTKPLNIGDSGRGGANPHDGKTDEIICSNTVYSAAWNKADYHSCWDTLLSYGEEVDWGEVIIIFKSADKKLLFKGEKKQLLFKSADKKLLFRGEEK